MQRDVQPFHALQARAKRLMARVRRPWIGAQRPRCGVFLHYGWLQSQGLLALRYRAGRQYPGGPARTSTPRT